MTHLIMITHLLRFSNYKEREDLFWKRNVWFALSLPLGYYNFFNFELIEYLYLLVLTNIVRNVRDLFQTFRRDFDSH